MKNKALLAFIGFLVMAASPALSAEVYKSKTVDIIIDGDVTIGTFVTDQDENEISDDETVKYSTGQVRADGRFGIQGETILDNGYKVGARGEILLDWNLEDVYIYLKGPFGEFRAGQAPNATMDLHLYVPEFLAPGLDEVDYPDFQASGRSSVAGGPQFGDSTFLGYDEFSNKITYLSPRIQGFKFGVSWTPDPTVGFDSSHTTGLSGRADDPDHIYSGRDDIVEDIISVGANFIRTDFGIQWGVSGNYLFGDQTEFDTSPGGHNAGINISWRNWEIGGSWQKSKDLMIISADDSTDASRVRDQVWTVGFAYSQDKWKAGAAYRSSRRDEGNPGAGTSSADKTNKEIEIGAAYDLGKGLWVSAMFEFTEDFDPTAETARIKASNFGFLLTYQF